MPDVTHNTLAGTELHGPFQYNQSGDPGAVGAGTFWLDTTSAPFVLKRRNAGNSAWDTVGAAGGGETGPAGPTGAAGATGAAGTSAASPANVFWAADYATPELAVAAANAAVTGGATSATVNFGPGLFLTNGIDIGSSVAIIGAGSQLTTIKLNNTQNRAVIRGPSTFSSLTGTAKATPETRGANWVQLRGLTIDGNKANQTAGRGVELWGKGMRFVDVRAVNCFDDGIYTEYTNHDGLPTADPASQSIEAFFSGIWCVNNGDDGFRNAGPHDAMVHQITSWNNGGWGLRVEGAGGGSIGGASFSEVNTYLNTLGSLKVDGDVIHVAHGILSGDKGIGIDLDAGSGGVHVSDLFISGHLTGLNLRGSNHMIEATFLGHRDYFTTGTPGRAIVVDGAQNCYVRANGSDNEVAVRLNTSGDTGNNDIEVLMSVDTGGGDILYDEVGTPSARTRWYVRRPDSFTDGISQLPEGNLTLIGRFVVATDGINADNNPQIISSYSTPEAAIYAPRGSICMVAGGGGGAVYRKTTDIASNTGWTAM